MGGILTCDCCENDVFLYDPIPMNDYCDEESSLTDPLLYNGNGQENQRISQCMNGVDKFVVDEWEILSEMDEK